MFILVIVAVTINLTKSYVEKMGKVIGAQLYEINAGKLVSIELKDGAWCFGFERNFYMESYAGWRLLIHSNGANVVIGSRDLELEKNKLQTFLSFIGDVPCTLLTNNVLSNVRQLQFLDEDGNRISLELLVNSAFSPNFKVVIDGEEYFDIENRGKSDKA